MEEDKRNPKSGKLSREEYIKGVKSGELMHVYNKDSKKIEMIKRDGYYPEHFRKKLINIEHPDIQNHPKVEKIMKKIRKIVYEE